MYIKFTSVIAVIVDIALPDGFIKFPKKIIDPIP